tara:strand:- start:2575 stop:3321 length:747 start_codon:yes stop_codon:yes gene_type:complete
LIDLDGKRQIVLDTETTGLEPSHGHRIIEIGCVELVNRRLTGNTFHTYLQPDREIDEAAIEVHGITNEFLADKPYFKDIANELIEFLRDSEVIIHNAPFDVGFINSELSNIQEKTRIESICVVLDTLIMARKMHPGQRNSLDALCSRYEIDNSRRTKHGALLDSEILADVFLAMTGGQKKLTLEDDDKDELESGGVYNDIKRVSDKRSKLPVILATEDELHSHEQKLDSLEKISGKKSIWREIFSKSL